MKNIEEWAKDVGGRFARVMELTLETGALVARIRTDAYFDGIKYRVPEDVHVPLEYRDWLNKGEIDHRQFKQKEGR